ncbi:MAG: bifunctional diguanylate cyclase/phosphohydrolase [Thermomicrobiales bacterium]
MQVSRLDCHRRRATGTQLFWLGVVLTLLFNSGLALVLLVGARAGIPVEAVSDLGQFLGPLLVLPLCFIPLRSAGTWRHSPAVGRQEWAARLLGLGTGGFIAGQILWSFYELALRQPTPTPSWDDASFLLGDLLLLAGVLLLPGRPMSLTARLCVLLDGLLIVVMAMTFSWFFLIGPTVLGSDLSPAGKLITIAYPCDDLLLFSSLLVLLLRRASFIRRPAPQLLMLALAIIIVVDSVYSYQVARDSYTTGTLLDLGWPIEYMLIPLAAYALRLAVRQQPVVERQDDHMPRAPRLWRGLLPYLVLPAIATLLLYTWQVDSANALKVGVRAGLGGAMLVLLMRQLVALAENAQLYRRLQAAHDELATSHTALLDANTRLETLATVDPLTGLPNHRAMVAALDQELERAHHYRQPCALLFLDLDHFKALNDGYGHQTGDAVLTALGAVTREALRAVDIIGRWGGEEFVAVLPQSDRAAALALAERVRVAVATHPFAIGGGVRLTCSIGVAAYPQDAEERDGLIAAADQAMYAAKHLGRNQARAADDPAVGALVAGEPLGNPREEAALTGTVEALAGLVAARDHYTGQHTTEVGALAVRIALALDCVVADARMVGLAGRLHDIGKVAIPDAILLKLGRLSPQEWALMKTHPVVGADIVSRVPALRGLAPAIRSHHERWDGQGYPDGLTGEAIPLGARILAVADTYSAITTDRPYQPARDADWALTELQRCAGTQFDPDVVEALARVLTTTARPTLLAVAG